MKRLTFKSTCILCLATSFLTAFSLSSEEEKEHVRVGSRVLSLEDHRAAQRAKLQEELSREGDPNIQSEIADPKGQNEEVIERKSSALSLLGAMTHHAYFYTTHSGAFYQAIAISPSGDTIELHDGSVWQVRSWDSHKTLDWLASDVLTISPNHSWFSPYQFRITNQNTGGSIAVNLSLGPIYNNFHTHWILDIDYYNSTIVLEDGSMWNMSIFDSIDDWEINDTVIIGVNDGWFSSTRPNILINVNLLVYARGISSY